MTAGVTTIYYWFETALTLGGNSAALVRNDACNTILAAEAIGSGLFLYSADANMLAGFPGGEIGLIANLIFNYDGNFVSFADASCAGPSDTDGDGLTDDVEAGLCTDPLDPDTDGDGLLDGEEVLAGTDPCNPDENGNGIPDGIDLLIDESCPPDAVWKNHGAYVKCVAHVAEGLLEAGLISEAEKDLIVSTAAQSDVGKKSK